MKYYLAIDLGASSGRHIVGYEKDGELLLDEVHRFPNGMKSEDGKLVWDTQSLFSQIKTGIKKAFEKYPEIESLAIDTWGVDYALLKGDQTVYPVYAYRDSRTLAIIDEVHSKVSAKDLYASTGIQFQAYNTIYQLYADLKAGRLEGATDFLQLPAYFSYLLTGVKKTEYTNATTGGYISAKTKQFDNKVLQKLGLPQKLFGEISQPGEYLGVLKKEVADEVGGNCKVVLCASHDTASAFEAVDCPDDSIIISSGTWSLIGVKLKQACVSEASLKANFSNEGGVGYFRYLKNIMGMWLINELNRKKNIPIQNVVKLASQSEYREIFDVNDSSLSAPTDMEAAIKALLAKSGQPLPKTDGDLFNSVYCSLAQSYRLAIKEMEEILGRTFSKVYIVGGGAKNAYLNELTQKATGKNVIALPIEATAIGNIKVQLSASRK